MRHFLRASLAGVAFVATSLVVAAPAALRFEPNLGQEDPAVAFLARAGAVRVLFEGSTIRIHRVGTPSETDAVVTFRGGSESSVFHGVETLRARIVYVVPDDTAPIEAPTWGAVVRRGIYPGIDLVVRGADRRLEVELIAAPDADRTAVRLEIEGIASSVDPSGSRTTLHLPEPAAVALGSAAIPAPAIATAPDGRVVVASAVRDELASIALTTLDPSGREILQTTYLVVPGLAAPTAIAIAPNGETVLAVTTDSGEGVILRLDADRRAIVGRVTLGRGAVPHAIAVAGEGVVVAGSTFAARLAADLRIAWTRSLAGTGLDDARAIAVDAAGAIWLAGTVATAERGTDAAVVKLEPLSGTPLLTATFGGSGDDAASAIAISRSGEPVIAGTTRSGDLPIVRGGQPALGGGADGFLARFDAEGSVVFSTYVGGEGDERATALALDRAGRARVGGTSASAGLDAFSATVDLDGAGRVALWRISGSHDDTATAIAVDPNSGTILAGLTASPALPGTTRLVDVGGADVFAATLAPEDVGPLGTCPGTKQWIGGVSNAWETAANWSGGTLPAAGDDVCVSSGTVVLTNGVSSVASIRVQSGATFTMNGGSVTLAGPSELQGTFTMNGGTLGGAGNVAISGTFSWTGGIMTGSGTTTVSAPWTASGAGFKDLTGGRIFRNPTTATWTGTGPIRIGTSAVLDNSGTIEAQNDAVIQVNFTGPSSVENSGTFRKSAGAGASSVSIPFNNTGSVQVQSGTLSLSGGGAGSSSFDVSSGATLQFAGNVYDWNAGIGFTGNGTVLLSASTLNVNVPTAIPSTMAFTMTGGTLQGAGSFTTNGTFNWSAGTMTAAGTTTVNGPFTISGAGFKDATGSRVLNNNQTATWTGTGPIRIGTGAVLNNAGTFDAQNDAVIQVNFTGPSSVNNSGTFRKSAGAGTTSVSIPFNNTGAVQVQTGTVSLTGGGASSSSFDVASSRTLQFAGSTYDWNAGTAFTGNGTVVLSAGTVNVNAATAIPATTTLTLSGAILQGTATLTTNGTFNWSAGTMTAAGTTTANGSFNISGVGFKDATGSRIVNNNQTATWTGAGPIRIGTGAVLNNAGTFDAQNDALIQVNFTGPSSVNNSGTFRKSAGAGTTTVSIPFNNTGAVHVQSGTVSLSGGGTSSSSFDVAGSTTLQFAGNTYDWNAGTLFVGSGTVLLSGGTLNVNTPTAIPPTETFTMTGGILQGAATFTTNGTFNWSAGTLTGAGTVTANATFNVSGAGFKDVTGDRALSLNGIGTWTGTGPIRIGTGAAFNNAGTFDALNDAAIQIQFTGPASVNNTGTFRKSAGSGTTAVSIPFSNTGTVEVQTGTLNVSSSSYTQTAGVTRLTGGALTSSTTIAVQGGRLAGSGTVTGPVVVSGTGALSPGLSPGSLSLVGDYAQQGPSGAFEVEIGGTTPGSQHDRAEISGTNSDATLAGVLRASLVGGYVPVSGASFTVMTYPSRTGSLALDLPAAGCLGWLVDQGPTSIVLSLADVPVELAGLSFALNKTTISWGAPPIHPATVYDLLRGDLRVFPVGTGPGESCVSQGGTATSADDATVPAVGGGFWYVVRERVPGCGDGGYGRRSDGTERVSPACP